MSRKCDSVNTLKFISQAMVGAAMLAVGVSTTMAQSPYPLSLDPSALSKSVVRADISSGESTREGFLGLLDSRSIYAKDWFPEPLLADESGLDNEFAMTYFHAEKKNQQTDQLHVEVEKSFGQVTLEIGGGYEADRSATFDPDSGTYDREHEQGITNIELGARCPILELVSDNGVWDNTVVFGMELSPPSGSQISKDTEIVPKFFDMLKIGEHFSFQAGLGLSTLIGPQERGLQTLEYDAVFGYELIHEVFPLPFVVSTTPMFELDGETTLNKEDAGLDNLSATVGFRLNFDSIGRIQPKLGLGYVMPVDSGAREDFHWGVVTSLIFEY